MNQHSRRTRSRPFAGLPLLLVLAACGGDRGGGDGAPRDPDGDPEPGGAAVTAELSDIANPLPMIFNTSLDGDMMDVMYMGLTRGAWRDGRLEFLTADESPMALARRWELFGPDSAGLRYHMRSDLTWSDGRPITAHDVAWTYDMVRNPAVASPRSDYLEHIDSVRVESDSTVAFHFKRRMADMLFFSGLPIAPRHAFEGSNPANIRSHPRLLNPGGGNLPVSGAFMFGSWSKGERVVLVPNPRFRPRPHLEQIVIRVIPEQTTRLVELQTGTVDLTRPVPPDQVDPLRQQAPFVRFEREEKRNYDYIAYNPRAFEPFADPEVRLALGLALDVPGIIRALRLGEFAAPAGGPYSPIFTALYDPEAMGPLPYDPDRARRILESKGWRDTNGDGWLDRNGRTFRFTLLTNAGNARRADVSQIVQQQWKQIGVDAQLRQMETTTMYERLQRKEFQAMLAGWSVALSPDLGNVWSDDSPFNFVSYSDPEVFALFDRARGAPTEDEANALWKEAAARVVAARPYTWLYFLDGVVGVNDRLRGARIDTYGVYQNTWEWWIPRDRQRGRSAAPAAGGDTGAAAEADTARR